MCGDMVRSLFIMSFLANVALALVSLAVLPPRVAIHFGRGGLANGWASNWVNALIFLGTDALLFCSLYFSPRLVFVFPKRWINLPNRDYWLTDENTPRVRSMISSLMWEFGVAVFLFLFVAGLLTIEANLSNPVRLNEKLFFAAFILFMAYTVFWCVRFFRAFRIPAETGDG